jgi:hypothetical protein
MAANNDLGSLSYSLNIDISQLPDTIRNVEKQLSGISTVADISTRVDANQLIGAIKQALQAEDFKLKVTLDDSFKSVIGDAASVLKQATTGGEGEKAQLGYIDSLIAKLKELETQYKNLPKGADASSLVKEFVSVQTELERVGKNLSAAFNKSWADINKMAESTIGDLKSKIKSLEQYKLNIPLSNPAEITRVNDLINKLKGDISSLFQTQQVNPFQLTENSIKEIEAKIKVLKEVRSISPINSQEFINADNALSRLQGKISHIGKLNLSQSLALPERTIENLKDKLKALESLKIRVPMDSYRFQEASKEIERLKKLLSEVNNPPKATRSFAEVMGMDTNTLNHITEKLNEIRRLRGEINVNNPNGILQLNSLNKAEADLLRLQQQRLGANKQINETYASQTSLVDNLTSKALAYFSLEKMQQFANKLIEIRGEFEKQQVALQVILQSKDQADKLFSQVVNLGLNSPFSIMQLNSYVKGLAAYRIETDQLFDTTKRLADISSGLGVDMGRLILAYGQVRAASVLRGQEVRQFTEAGIPLIEALADQFTKLEGRVVSTNEVFDKISNRLVPFEMVRDVLFEMTDAGGVFFNMQEKQAETLGAKWKNLQDAIDVMYNSIGQDNEGFLKGMAETLTDITRNWRQIFDLITASVTALGVMKALSVGKRLLDIGAVMNQGFSYRDANYYVRNLASNTDILALRTQNVGKQWTGVGRVFGSFANSVKSFALANWPMFLIGAIAAIGTKLYTSYKEAERFKNELSAIGVEGIKEADALVEAHEELRKKLEETTEGTIARKEAIDKLNSQFGSYYSNTITDINAQQMLASEYENVNAKIRENTRLKAQDKVRQKVEEKYGDDINTLYAKIISDAEKDDNPIPAKQMHALISEIEKRAKDKNNYDSFDLLNIAASVGKDFELSKKQIATLRRLMGGVNAFGYKDGIESWLGKQRERDSDLNDAQRILDIQYGDVMPGATKRKMEEWDAKIKNIEQKLEEDRKKADSLPKDKRNSSERDKNRAETEALESKKNLALEYGWTDKYKEFDNQLKRIKINVTQIQKASEKLFGLDSKSFDGLKQITSLDAMQGEYKRLTDALKNPKLYNPEKDKDGLTDLEKDKKKLEDLKKLAKELDIDLNPKASQKAGKEAEDARLTKYKAEVALVKEANGAYKKYLDVLDRSNAKAKVKENFATQFKNLGIDIKYASDELSYYQSVSDRLSKGTSKKDIALWNSVNKEIGGTQSEDEIEALKKQWQDLNELFDLKKEAYALRDMYMQKGVSKEVAESFVKQIYGDISLEFDNFQDDVSAKLSDASGNWGSDAGIAFKKRFGQEAKNSFLEMLDKFQTTQQKIDGINYKYAQIFKDLEIQKGKVSAEVYAGMVANAETAKAQEIAAVTEGLLEMTDAYQRLFGNIADLSEKEIAYLIEKFRTAIDQAQKAGKGTDGLFHFEIDGEQFSKTEKQMSSLVKSLTKAEADLRNRNPFKALLDSFKQLQAGLQDKKDKKDEIESLEKYISVTKNTEGYGSSPVLQGSVASAEKKLASLKDKLKAIDAQNASTWMKMSLKISAVTQSVTDLGGSVVSLFEAFGADEDVTGTLNDIIGIVGGLGDTASGVARIASGDIIGGITQGIKGIAGVVSSITSLGDRKHEKQIRRLQEAIDASKIAYEELGRAASKALGNAEYDTKKLQIAELKRQQQLIQGQIREENAKKKTDKDKIKNWEEEYRRLGHEIEDVITGITESLIGNIKDMANEMAGALVQAFEAGDNAQEAMFKSIKNNLKQSIANQFQKSVIDNALAPLFKRMDEMLGITADAKAITDQQDKIAKLKKQYDENPLIDIVGNGIMRKAIEQAESDLKKLQSKGGNYAFTPEQVKELLGQAGKISEDVMDIFNSGGWKEIFDALTGSKELSGLSKGIQGLTEDTAQILEAYLNTIRDVVISIMTVQENQLSVLQASQLIQSQILTEVATMSSATVSMNNAIRSALAQAQGDRGAGFRVYIQ